MSKVVLLTGGSKGLGFAAAKSFAGKGCKVYELSRHETENPGVVHIPGDVTDASSVEAAVNTVLEREGHIDVLVCNAGTVMSGAIECVAVDEVRKLMELNFYGVVNCVRAVLPHMRKAGGGRIVVISSMAAAFPIPFQAYYSVSKSAVATYASALSNEVKPFGISVCYIMPGDTKTDPVRSKCHDGDDVYRGRIERSVAVMERDEENGMDPEKVGTRISAIALKKHVRSSYSIGFMSKIQLVLKRLITEKIALKIIGMMYAK